ncbi:MAG: sigma-70 family RNA polymerase sigma factor [Planctomycetota bacterium]
MRTFNVVVERDPETLAAAVEHPPCGEGGETMLRAWLARVLRRLVARARRGEGRRRAREERAARPERLDSAAAIVARAEEHRIVVETVLALDEPYRTALLLRYFAGRSAGEIAAAMDCSVEAARKRVSRGLEQMRRALDARHGEDRGAWRRGLFALARPVVGRGF